MKTSDHTTDRTKTQRNGKGKCIMKKYKRKSSRRTRRSMHTRTFLYNSFDIFVVKRKKIFILYQPSQPKPNQPKQLFFNDDGWRVEIQNNNNGKNNYTHKHTHADIHSGISKTKAKCFHTYTLKYWLLYSLYERMNKRLTDCRLVRQLSRTFSMLVSRFVSRLSVVVLFVFLYSTLSILLLLLPLYCVCVFTTELFLFSFILCWILYWCAVYFVPILNSLSACVCISLLCC